MSKFGEIINSEIPIFIHFYLFLNEENETLIVEFLKQIAKEFGSKARVIKIEMEKNEELVKALNVKDNPTFVIYKNSELIWRHGGEETIENLVEIIEQFL